MLNSTTVTYDEAKKFFDGYFISAFKDQISFLSTKIDKNKDMLDIGSNIGYYSLCMINKIPDFSGTVHLFEPISNLASLCDITMKNTKKNYKIYNVAVSDNNSKEIIYTDTVQGSSNIGWNTLIKEQTNDKMLPVEIDCIRIDSLDIDFNNVGFIKIDTEGAEYKVLKGMISKFDRIKSLPVLVIEVGWGKGGHPNWKEELEYFHKLESFGYNIVNHHNQKVIIENINSTQDIIFIPK